MKTFSLALAVAAVTTTVNAQDVMVWGSGTTSCGSWTKDANNSPVHHQREGWLLGFVSGYNWYAEERGQDIKTEDGAALVAWVDNYCFTRPLDLLVVAAKRLIDELRRREGLLN